MVHAVKPILRDMNDVIVFGQRETAEVMIGDAGTKTVRLLKDSAFGALAEDLGQFNDANRLSDQPPKNTLIQRRRIRRLLPDRRKLVGVADEHDDIVAGRILHAGEIENVVQQRAGPELKDSVDMFGLADHRGFVDDERRLRGTIPFERKHPSELSVLPVLREGAVP